MRPTTTSLIGVLALLLALLVPGPALAEEPVPVDIVVGIKHGGTALIKPLDGAPEAEVDRLELGNNQFGSFHVVFSQVGTYHYTISQVVGTADLDYDETVYEAVVYVVSEDDELSAVVNVYDQSGEKIGVHLSGSVWNTSGGGGSEIYFENRVVVPIEPGASGSGADDGSGSGSGSGSSGSSGSSSSSSSTGRSSSSRTTSRPQTGDSGLLERYFLQAMLAAAGLFVLSLVYLRNTLKWMRSRKR